MSGLRPGTYHGSHWSASRPNPGALAHATSARAGSGRCPLQSIHWVGAGGGASVTAQPPCRPSSRTQIMVPRAMPLAGFQGAAPPSIRGIMVRQAGGHQSTIASPCDNRSIRWIDAAQNVGYRRSAGGYYRRLGGARLLWSFRVCDGGRCWTRVTAAGRQSAWQRREGFILEGRRHRETEEANFVCAGSTRRWRAGFGHSHTEDRSGTVPVV